MINYNSLFTYIHTGFEVGTSHQWHGTSDSTDANPDYTRTHERKSD